MKVGDSVNFLKYDSCEVVALTDGFAALRIPGGLVVNVNRDAIESKPKPSPVIEAPAPVQPKPIKKSKGK